MLVGMGIDKMMLADGKMNGATEWANRLRYNFDTPHLGAYISMPYLNRHRQSAPINLGRLDVNYNDRTRRVRGNHLAQKIREHFIHIFLPAFSICGYGWLSWFVSSGSCSIDSSLKFSEWAETRERCDITRLYGSNQSYIGEHPGRYGNIKLNYFVACSPDRIPFSFKIILEVHK